MWRILIIGCGDIGERVARIWADRGAGVSALVRDHKRAAYLRDKGITTIIGNLDDPDTLVDLPVHDAVIYYFAPPPNDGLDDPRMHAFVEYVGHKRHPVKIIYTSTTGVYGDRDGEWVTEQSPVNPQNLRSKRRVAAENILRKWHDATMTPVIILRVAGIYGPGRLPVERIRSGQAILDEIEAPYSNRIHSEDLARICIAAAEYTATGYHIFNVSDGHPTTMTDYYNRVAANADLAPPRTVSMEQATREFSPVRLSFLTESKRIDNHKMLDELGITLLYPDLETGLKQC
jgi:nucleoside-diphosphate-sugar epimerase